jgi:hypothetical protein
MPLGEFQEDLYVGDSLPVSGWSARAGRTGTAPPIIGATLRKMGGTKRTITGTRMPPGPGSVSLRSSHPAGRPQ